ncbi:MAG: hypothetical protein IJ858_05810 [Acidaminococcaceae bacterium]|nr:hypothetical protein [Acidaminococcaceae bacterium]
MLTRKKVLAVSLAVFAALNFTACGGGDKKGETKPAAPKTTVAVPARPAVSTAPSMSFKFGEKEAKVYELKGVDLAKKIRTNRLAVANGAAYFFVDMKPMQLGKVTLKNETISDLTLIANSGGIDFLATNGKEVLFRTSDGKMGVYDGKQVAKGDKWLGETIGAAGSNEFYIMQGTALKAATLEGNSLKNIHDIIADYKKIPAFDRAILKPVYADSNEIYLRTFLRKEGVKDAVPTLVVFDKQGKELRRYEGVQKLPRGWAVTANYVIHTGSMGDFRVFDRATGKKLGDAKVGLRPFALYTITGNDVLLYDDRADKLYRIDF